MSEVNSHGLLVATRTFRGLMLRAWAEGYDWLVSFDGEVFYQVPEMPRIGNAREMEAYVADKLGCVTREYFKGLGTEDSIITVVSNRRGGK